MYRKNKIHGTRSFSINEKRPNDLDNAIKLEISRLTEEKINQGTVDIIDISIRTIYLGGTEHYITLIYAILEERTI